MKRPFYISGCNALEFPKFKGGGGRLLLYHYKRGAKQKQPQVLPLLLSEPPAGFQSDFGIARRQVINSEMDTACKNS